MKPEISVHIVPQDGKWAVRRSGAKKAARVFLSKPSAAEYVSRSYKGNRLRIYVHDMTGRIERRILR